MNIVFISHSSSDVACAKRIANNLEMRGIDCWLAPRNILPGKSFVYEITNAIVECGYFVVLLSGASCASEWVEREVIWAISKKKNIIPLVLGHTKLTDEFEFMLQKYQMRYVDDNIETVIDEIVEHITNDKSELPECLSIKMFYERAQDKNFSEDATKWVACAAEQGYAMAQKILGDAYMFGVGVPVCFDEAFRLYKKAAEKRMPDALYSLATCYDCGYGTAENAQMASKYYLEAARLGHISAQYCIGTMYESGEGVEQDLGEAYKWYIAAASQGEPEAAGKCQLSIC